MSVLSNPTITISELKRILAQDGDRLEVLVRHNIYGKPFGSNVHLPQSCRPARATLMFGYYAGIYLLFFDRDVLHCGADPYLEELCKTGSIGFYSWRELIDFCLMLPEYF